MELCGHAWGLYRSLRPYCSHERASEIVKAIIPKLVLPDTVRYLVRPTEEADGKDIVKFGRGYSHFTDGCAMRLPIGDELKSCSGITETMYLHRNGYRNKFADEPTNFDMFFRCNTHMFTIENLIWGLAVLSHLQQDVATDTTWQNNLCQCDTGKNEVLYVHTGRVVTGKEFREDMAIANVWFHRYFRQMIMSEFGDNLTQEWLEQNVCEAFYEAYSEGMATNSCKYLKMDPRVFDDSEEVAEELIATLKERGLISCEADLKRESDMLIGSAVGSCATLVNHVIRL